MGSRGPGGFSPHLGRNNGLGNVSLCRGEGTPRVAGLRATGEGRAPRRAAWKRPAEDRGSTAGPFEAAGRRAGG